MLARWEIIHRKMLTDRWQKREKLMSFECNAKNSVWKRSSVEASVSLFQESHSRLGRTWFPTRLWLLRETTNGTEIESRSRSSENESRSEGNGEESVCCVLGRTISFFRNALSIVFSYSYIKTQNIWYVQSATRQRSDFHRSTNDIWNCNLC